MYCKKCGKQIADNSKFCKYCGTLVDESLETDSTNDSIQTDTRSEIIVSTKEESPVKIEIAKNATIKKTTIANEVMANLKMVVIASVIWVVYIIGFIVVHQKDIKSMNEKSWYGESCYDPSFMSGNWITNWQNQLAIKVLMAHDYSKPRKRQKGVSDQIQSIIDSEDFTPLKNSDYSLVIGMNAKEALDYAGRIAQEKRITKDRLDELKKEAISDAQKDKESFWDEINSSRKSGYENDLYNNMKWVAIIALAITILGRYIIKFGKWVANNKTE